MNDLQLIEGDYVPDGLGSLNRVSGYEAVIQRILFRLSAKRGQFPLLPNLGSQLYLLHRQPRSHRLAAAQQFVAEALQEETDVSVQSVSLSEPEPERFRLTVSLLWQGEALAVSVSI